MNLQFDIKSGEIVVNYFLPPTQNSTSWVCTDKSRC